MHTRRAETEDHTYETRRYGTPGNGQNYRNDQTGLLLATNVTSDRAPR